MAKLTADQKRARKKKERARENAARIQLHKTKVSSSLKAVSDLANEILLERGLSPTSFLQAINIGTSPRPVYESIETAKKSAGFAEVKSVLTNAIKLAKHSEDGGFPDYPLNSRSFVITKDESVLGPDPWLQDQVNAKDPADKVLMDLYESEKSDCTAVIAFIGYELSKTTIYFALIYAGQPGEMEAFVVTDSKWHPVNSFGRVLETLSVDKPECDCASCKAKKAKLANVDPSSDPVFSKKTLEKWAQESTQMAIGANLLVAESVAQALGNATLDFQARESELMRDLRKATSEAQKHEANSIRMAQMLTKTQKPAASIAKPPEAQPLQTKTLEERFEVFF